MRCTEGHELVEVDNPVRREFRHQRGVVCTASFAKPSKPPEGASPIGRLDAEALESQRAHERDLAQPARPVEDREPVGPYAPTRTPNLDDRAAAAPERFEAGYRQGWRERHVYGTPRYKGLPTLTNRPEGGTELGDYLVEQFGSVGTRLDGLVDVVLRQEQRIVEAIEPIRATTTPQPKLKLSEIRSGLTEGWLAERFDRIDTALAQLTDLFVDSRDEIERIKASAECTIDHSSEPVQMVQFKEAFERGRQQGDADRAQRLERTDEARAVADARERNEARQQGFDNGVAIGKSEREAELLDQGWTPSGNRPFLSIDTEDLEVTSGPTDYEVWRDALTLAVEHSAEGAEIPPNAFWFHGLLMAGYDGARADEGMTRVTEHEAAADLPAKETPGAEADYPF